MAKEKGKTGKDEQQDDSRFAKPFRVGNFGDRGDRVVMPGVGVCLSKHAVYDYEREADEAAEAAGDKKHDSNRYHKMVIPESAILAWARSIEKSQSMRKEAQAHAHEAECYDGTDTVDPAKRPQVGADTRNEFKLDKSESTISIHVTSGSRHLNGSTVEHSHYISLNLHLPNGREYGRIALTFDQFAAALVTSSATPCTWDSYWSVEDNCVLLEEVVREPDSIADRMEQRLNDRMQDYTDRFDKMRKDVLDRAETGKGFSKTQLLELVREFDILSGFYSANRNFCVEQAREEVTSIVEQAAISVAYQHNLTPQDVIRNAHLGTLLQSVEKKLGYTPKQDESQSTLR